MSSAIRHPKDFWTGVIFIAIGLGAVFTRGDLAMGTSLRMGPAFFPVVLGVLLVLIGAAGVLRSFFRHGEPMEKLHLKPLVLVTLAVVLFGFLMRGAGLVPAALVLVLVSASASPKFHWKEKALLAVGLAAFAYVLFIKLLGLPIPALGPWLGF
ncbi:tripartite tricarboxylate transporter TctB family protein [Pseudoduganella sp. HUAS MS19]